MKRLLISFLAALQVPVIFFLADVDLLTRSAIVAMCYFDFLCAFFVAHSLFE
jgi:hypothetical protein